MKPWSTKVRPTARPLLRSYRETSYLFPDACAKELTLRDLERLNAAGTMTATSIRGSYNQDKGGYMVSCTADMRPLAMEDDDLRVPSFLKNRARVPMRRMQVPGMKEGSGYSFSSDNDDASLGFLDMDFAMIADYTNVVECSAPSVCSSDASSIGRGKLSALRNSKVAKCVKGLKSWRKLPKPGGPVRETPAIKEDKDYDFADESLSFPISSALLKGKYVSIDGQTQDLTMSSVLSVVVLCVWAERKRRSTQLTTQSAKFQWMVKAPGKRQRLNRSY